MPFWPSFTHSTHRTHYACLSTSASVKSATARTMTSAKVSVWSAFGAHHEDCCQAAGSESHDVEPRAATHFSPICMPTTGP